ncbi:MAG: hypothetical protein GF368_03280 [Candidatus Aenigmarchaeota archaeon]|nr:hypothetical protein [Candidatus Aenigmarchaeota archaeon]
MRTICTYHESQRSVNIFRRPFSRKRVCSGIYNHGSYTCPHQEDPEIYCSFYDGNLTGKGNLAVRNLFWRIIESGTIISSIALIVSLGSFSYDTMNHNNHPDNSQPPPVLTMRPTNTATVIPTPIPTLTPNPSPTPVLCPLVDDSYRPPYYSFFGDANTPCPTEWTLLLGCPEFGTDIWGCYRPVTGTLRGDPYISTQSSWVIQQWSHQVNWQVGRSRFLYPDDEVMTFGAARGSEILTIEVSPGIPFEDLPVVSVHLRE